MRAQDERDELRALFASGHVTWPTRKALEQRLAWRCERRFFSEAEFARLRAVALRLVPHDLGAMDLACVVDDRLARGLTDGWRYADAPPDGEAYRELLGALPPDFSELPAEVQDDLLHVLQRGLPHVFEDLLAELVEDYYSHPLAQLAIGYIGFADAPRWNNIGLNELDERERVYGEQGDGEQGYDK